jgi:general stress protein 26
MADDREIEVKFWEALKDSPFIMLGIEGARDGATQPMTVNFDDEDHDAGLLWVFTAKDHDLTRAMGQSNGRSLPTRPKAITSSQAFAARFRSSTTAP